MRGPTLLRVCIYLSFAHFIAFVGQCKASELWSNESTRQSNFGSFIDACTQRHLDIEGKRAVSDQGVEFGGLSVEFEARFAVKIPASSSSDSREQQHRCQINCPEPTCQSKGSLLYT